jgi:hypothetical protein
MGVLLIKIFYVEDYVKVFDGAQAWKRFLEFRLQAVPGLYRLKAELQTLPAENFSWQKFI